MDNSGFRAFRMFGVIVLFLAIATGLGMAQQVSADPAPKAAVEPKSDVLVAEVLPSVTPNAPETASLREAMSSSSSAAALPNTTFRPTGSGAIAPAIIVAAPQPTFKPEAHPFWDHKNRTLFALNGAMAGADFFVTRQNLGHNGKELNPVARMFTGSTPALAANFALETGGVMGISYLFHKTGHHKLERITSYVNLGASSFAVSYGLRH